VFPHQGEVGAVGQHHLGGGATAPGQLLLGSQDPYPPVTDARVSATRIIVFRLAHLNLVRLRHD
jgi:hypothetical protein